MFNFTLTNGERYCGTCEYWQGAREIQYYGTRVGFEDVYVSAKCTVPQTGFQMGPNGTNHPACQYYKKWGALK